jgi:hypothetical protein
MIGLREMALLALVVLVLYGRSGVLKSRRAQTIWRWVAPVRHTRAPSAGARASASSRPRSTAATATAAPRPLGRARPFLLRGNRLFWFLTVLAATAVAALIITRMMIASGAGP